MAYHLEGSRLEVCNCNVLCPCWIGEDPDPGTCDAVNTYHIDNGQIDGVDVSGRTISCLVHIPGNVLKGNWKIVAILDDQCTPAQQDAILNAFGGKLGGPLKDVASLIGEIVSVERAPISFQVKEGHGSLSVGDFARAELEPYCGPTGEITTLNESIFTTIPGAPAWVSKATSYERSASRFGMIDLKLSGKNAIQGLFRFDG